MEHARAWAQEEFGEAELGDVRRTSRLVELAAACAERPAGVVTKVTATLAEREAAYRLLESDRVDNEALARPMFAASARRCQSSTQVIVALDQTTVSFVDRAYAKQLGRTGSISNGNIRRGFEVMSAFATLPNGQAAGLLSQIWYTRPEERTPERHADERPPEERESGLWMRAMKAANETLREHAPGSRAWYQLDRGADIGHVLLEANKLDADFTIRGQWTRRVERPGAHQKIPAKDRSYIHDVLRRSCALGEAEIMLPRRADVPGTESRTRRARFLLRAKRLSIRLQNSHGQRTAIVELNVVHIVERFARKPIEWFLITNRRVSTLAEAIEVIAAYRWRWRIEEFHRTWKSGLCDVEKSQLRSATALRRWATILAAVASRAEILKTRSRAEPDEPALVALTQDEVDAAILISRTKKFKPGDSLTLAQAVELIANLGGYTGKSSGGPPGVTVIGRGLVRVTDAAAAIAAYKTCGQ